MVPRPVKKAGGRTSNRALRGWGIRLLLGLVPAAVLLMPLWATAQGGGSRVKGLRARLAGGLSATLTQDHQVFVDGPPLRGEGLLAFSRRLTGSEVAAREISEHNDGARVLLSGRSYRVPYRLLRPELQLESMRALFGSDTAEAGAWVHRIEGRGSLPAESLVEVAEWFTGQPDHCFALRELNQLPGGELRAGDAVRIPGALLLPQFRALLPAAELIDLTARTPAAPLPEAEPVSPTPVTFQPATYPETTPAAAVTPTRAVATEYSLQYGRDAQGEYAIYRLKPGEALYSSVVVRFTGRILAADVNELAVEIAQRSRIRDVTDIPVGYRVKVPFELLLPEYLPASHPRRREYEEALLATSGLNNQVQALGLSGVTVILDSGHGGRDTGASFNGVWESLYVHDILLRVTEVLKKRTSARVLPTLADVNRSQPDDRNVLPYSRGHRVLTTPPYAIEEATIGTNLRWYLANSLLKKEQARGVDTEKVVFLSLHADSLHPSLRGAMIYVPDAQLRAGSFSKSGEVYAARSEVREQPQVSFSWSNRLRSEGLSRDLAANLISSFERKRLPVHPFKPVREKIIRRRNEYVPAVLRYNAVPAKVLVEVCNLANSEDRALLQTADHRQRIATAIVEGLLAYYGYKPDDPAVRVVSAGGS